MNKQKNAQKGITGFWLAPSYKCNNRCRWCYAGSKICKAQDMSLADAKRYISQMRDFGARICILVGGEPSIYPHVLRVVEFATKLGINIKVMTNGRRLSQRNFVRDLMSAGLSNCSISIEGTEAVHDYIARRKHAFAQTIRGLENCQNEGLPVNSITTIGSYNLHNIPALVHLFKQLGLKRSAFNMCSSQPSGFLPGLDDGTVGLAEYARLVEDVGLAYDFVRFYALVPLCIYDQNKLHKLLELGRLNVACALFANSVTIDPEGNLLPCTHMAGLNYGNLNEPKALDKLVARKEHDRQILSTHGPSQKCSACRLWNTCYGGCNLIWFSRKADEHVKGIS